MSGTKMLKENGGCTPHAIAWSKHDADPNASEKENIKGMTDGIILTMVKL